MRERKESRGQSVQVFVSYFRKNALFSSLRLSVSRLPVCTTRAKTEDGEVDVVDHQSREAKRPPGGGSRLSFARIFRARARSGRDCRLRSRRGVSAATFRGGEQDRRRRRESRPSSKKNVTHRARRKRR